MTNDKITVEGLKELGFENLPENFCMYYVLVDDDEYDLDIFYYYNEKFFRLIGNEEGYDIYPRTLTQLKNFIECFREEEAKSLQLKK